MKDRLWLKKSAVITFTEISRRTKSKEYAKLLVHRLIKSGVLTKITRGTYTTSENIFSISANIYFPSYVSGISASSYYGCSEIIPLDVTVITSKKHKSINFKGYKIEFVHSKNVWGYHKEGKGPYQRTLPKNNLTQSYSV